MHRFIQFNDETIDSFLFMELLDLTKTLTKEPEMDVAYAPHSYLNLKEKKLFVSHFWDHRSKDDERNGLKSDIYLRALGNYWHTDFNEVNRYLRFIKNHTLSSFGKQIFKLGEDLRLEEIKERRGTVKSFQTRRKIYVKYFEAQLKVNLTKSVHSDSLFNSFFLMLQSENLFHFPYMKEEIQLALPFLQRELQGFFEAKSTKEIVEICLIVMDVLEEILSKDMLNEYFHLPEEAYKIDFQREFDELKRKDALKNDDEIDPDGEEEVFEEKMEMWHRETSESSEAFLQFDIEQGSKTNIVGNSAREGDDQDQALGSVQGSKKQTKRNDYQQLEALDSREEESSSNGAYGAENRHALPLFLQASPITNEQRIAYDELKKEVAPYRKKLQKMIEKTLEQKKIQPRSDLLIGRLNKKLLRYYTDEHPRLFYKNQNPSTEIDAAFSLLVDCSASMFDKMDETKRGIALFHEALSGVKVPHEVVGFWEDTNSATKNRQPNYFQTSIEFHESLLPQSGAEIMQLEPQEDNRDGLAIRVMTERMLTRSEKQKFLLVFSDGEPAALGYEQNGIVDTHEAVLLARKQDIEVMNIFLSNGTIAESQKEMIRNMYGQFSIFVTDVSELPDVLFPLLRKLLYKSI
ncbi:hypothetical protein Q75_07720 [Bacillus coahuilensis p1.1.43]|uniref:VWFA domain-containing protein n=1 Tax=Bacillus coahuilensis p1.1.43 TaxID=1150625 RepID=A0A147K899_9BACI|nr:VWA domain-containing protein [Bacillus coahuilensis]KUP06420.1 hypothetical protein Q75_07720 [Bacillus coahuilensis p1.1.43]